MNRNWIALWIVLIACAGTARSQSADDLNKLRIAQALEQAGEFAKALDFYKQLYDSSPNNIVYFDGLRRTYMNLKDYMQAEQVIRRRLTIEPNNVGLYCELGDVYYKNGSLDSAEQTWKKAIDLAPKNPATYQAVADVMTQNRLFDKAVEILREGERTTSNKSGFIIQIARLYFYGMNYGESLKELLGLLKSDNAGMAMAYIQSQLAEYGLSPDAVNRFTAEMRKEVDANPDNLYYREILAYLFMQRKDYADAYGTYKWLDDRSGAKGIQLLTFAETAYNDEAYAYAAEAYKEVSSISTAEPVVARAVIGYANSLRSLGEKVYTDDERPCASGDSLQDFNAALVAYGKIMTDYPASGYLSSAVLNSIEIEMNYLHNLNEAERLFSEYGNVQAEYAGQEKLLRIELYMKEGRFSDALNASVAELPEASRLSPGVAQDSNFVSRLTFEAASALYYMGNFDSSTYYLNRITANPMSDAANESIQMLNLIENNKPFAKALTGYAQAGSMEMSGRIPEAAAQLQQVIKDYPQAPLAANAEFDLGAAYCTMGNVAGALKCYSDLAKDSTGVFADRAQFRIAKIYESTLHDNTRAIQEYESFLARFPNSIYQDRVRGILRNLLGPNS